MEIEGLPSGVRARPATADDLDAVVAVMRADEAADRGEPDVGRADVVADWARPRFDLSTQSLVVEAEDAVVAYAESAYHRTGVRVHPDHHGRGIGGALLDWAEDNARRRGEARVGQTVYDGNAAALDLHRRRGYRVRWETWLLAIDHDGDVAVPPAPKGFTLRQVDLDGDARAVYDAIDTAFSTWSERDPYDFDDWRASYWDLDDVEARWNHVVEHDGQVVGACMGVVDGADGVVDQLGVLPAFHGRGLGGLLLRNAFARFAEGGLRRTVLSTESRGTARGFYEHHGMYLLRSFTRFVKDL